jgi:hypothetical protein
VTTIDYFLASALPALLWMLRAIVLRRVATGATLLIDLALFLISAPIAMELIGRILDFPPYAGDHSPGIGVAFALLFLVWLACMAVWVLRVTLFAYRRLKPAR